MFMSASPPPPPPLVTADEKGCTRDREEQTHFHFQSMLTSTLRLLISYLHLHLILSHTDFYSHPITQNLQNLELGKLTFTVATTATLGLVFSPGFPHVKAHYFAVVGLMVGCALIWNGILFGIISLQLIGITLIMCLLCLLVGSFLFLGMLSSCCSVPRAVYLPSYEIPQAAAGEEDDA